ncbi:flexible cuticle protein 12-like [Diabrotica undecimpunctata]|uniref:flexible cuticle protein 12-like n=1 Tax=Diabrotica undecimpunctata TaxID=50387 RepID=UPI003B638DD4
MKVLIVVSALIAVACAAAYPQLLQHNSPFKPLVHGAVHPVLHPVPHPAVHAVHPVVQPQQHVARSGAYDSSKDAKVLRYDSESSVGNEGYRFAVETSDGQQREEQAVLENAGTKEESLSVVGRYFYPGPNGETFEVNYVADKDGFRATGPHLPQPVQPVH